MMQFLMMWLATAVVFLPIDALWLKFVAGGLYRARLGDMILAQPKLAIAGGFYVLFCAGLAWFALRPALVDGGMWAAARDGALLGLIAYMTYDVTNLSTLRGWPLDLSVIDTIWGTVLSGFSAAAGFWIATRVFGIGG